MVVFLNFLVIITLGLFFAGALRKFKIPYVTALILAGVIFGPNGLNILVIDETIETVGAIGVIFLMFMAGFESNLDKKKKFDRSVYSLVLLNALIPFSVGLLIGLGFGYNLVTSLILGIVFISSSIAVIVPQLEESGFIKKKLGKTILSATLIEDILSLLLLSFALNIRSDNPVSGLVYFVVLPISFFVLKKAINYLNKFYSWLFGKGDQYESELRYLFLVLIGTAIFFEILGVHSIVAGFIAGMILSAKIKHDHMIVKLRTISYGFFIPIFFVLIGSELDLSVFTGEDSPIFFFSVLVLGLIGSKILSGYLSAKGSGFSKKESLYVGISTTPQLSTTLAAAFAALELGFLDKRIATGLVILSVITTTVSPILLSRLSKDLS